MANVSQLNARTLRQAQEPYEVFEFDAIAYPGNSGSPVWHPDTGEVLGMVEYMHRLPERAVPEAKWWVSGICC